LTITVEWTKPEDNGGCAVLGFRLYTTDGSSDEFDQTEPETLVATMSDVDPSITQHTIDFPAGTVGDIYKIKVETYNRAGSVSSSSLYVALASLPAKPAAAPTSDDTVTDSTKLGIGIGLFTTDAETGGSTILQYEVQYDDGSRGDYNSIYTLTSTLLITHGILRSHEYKVRYRAMNFNGWGPYSDILYVRAAGVPRKPPAPEYISSDSTHITVSIPATEDDGGADVTAYELYIDTIQVTPAFELLSTDSSLTRVIEYAAPIGSSAADITAWEATVSAVQAGLERGKTYRLATVAVNFMGSSDYSQELRVALGRLPSQPGAVTKVETTSTETAVMLQWDESPEVDEVEIDGYILYADDGHHGELTQVFNGTGYPLTREFLVTGLTTGLPYRFELTAVNINGESPRSATVTYYACLKPSSVSAPVMTSTTRNSIAISWEEPQENGCPITGFTILRNTGAGDEATVSVDSTIT
jgi:hypothetical protein